MAALSAARIHANSSIGAVDIGRAVGRFSTFGRGRIADLITGTRLVQTTSVYTYIFHAGPTGITVAGVDTPRTFATPTICITHPTTTAITIVRAGVHTASVHTNTVGVTVLIQIASIGRFLAQSSIELAHLITRTHTTVNSTGIDAGVIDAHTIRVAFI